MPREITLPNGVIIEGVPDDATKYGVMEKAIRMGYATPEDFGHASMDANAATGQGDWHNFRTGIGRGMVDVARNVGNIMGLVDDEELAEADVLDRDLMSTKAGFTGSIVGELAATAPIGMGVGRAGTALLQARRANIIGRGTARTLTHPATRGAVEGAAYGALLGPHEDRGFGAALGGGLGASFGGLGRLLGNAWRNFRVTSLTPEAKQLMRETGEWIPLSQSADTSLVRLMYNGIVANLPVAGRKIRDQYDNAVGDLRHWVATKAHPDTPQANIALNLDDPVYVMMQKLDDYWSTAYDDVANSAYRTSGIRMPQQLRKLIEDVAEEGYRIPISPQVKGQRLLNLRNALNEIRSSSAVTEMKSLKTGMMRQIDNALGDIDDIIIKQSSDDIARTYQTLQAPYKNYMILTDAVRQAGTQGGEFTAKQLLGQAARRAGGTRGGGEVQRVANLARQALPEFPSRQGIFQIAAGLGLAASAFAGVGIPAAASAVGAISLGRMLASKSVQRWLAGQHRGGILNKVNHPYFNKMLQLAGYSARQQAAIKANLMAGED